jgi:hypothetical protein
VSLLLKKEKKKEIEKREEGPCFLGVRVYDGFGAAIKPNSKPR